MARLTCLPAELHCAIASLLRPRDIVNLRASCRAVRIVLTKQENRIVQKIIAHRYSFLATKVPLPQERISIDPKVHEAMETDTSLDWSRSRRLGRAYPISKLEYPPHFCKCASCVYAWQLIWEKTYEALWHDWMIGLEERHDGINSDVRLGDFVTARMQAFVAEIAQSQLAYAYLLDYLLENLAKYLGRKISRIVDRAIASPVAGLCQPTGYSVPDFDIDSRYDDWIRDLVDHDNSDRPAREREWRGSVTRRHSKPMGLISGGFAFLSDELEPNKSMNPGLGHNILQYLAEMKVLIDYDEDIEAHEASLQERLGAEAVRNNAVIDWAPSPSQYHSQAIQLRMERLFRFIALSVSYDGQDHVWFPTILSERVFMSWG
ncbi:hypothetical protein AOQ84DRAFT_392051 [Glonium stellatum]|uniref:F-box domain-containing protein n=1 Tax=Glonium stellatum TaxID=574774 RepID=A0A8E2ERX4_9PEZI|nr:hypothetical protein AOQ84DRAFT_392051 [Glonium stellatum]